MSPYHEGLIETYSVWLRSVSEKMDKMPINGTRYYHGFDISTDQFPSDPGNIHYSVQDILKPFHAEHLSRYDLVHVRFLVGAIREADYTPVVVNLLSLLS